MEIRLTNFMVLTSVFRRINPQFPLPRIFIFVVIAFLVTSCETTPIEDKEITDQQAKLFFDGSKVNIKTTSHEQGVRGSLLIETMDIEGDNHGIGMLMYVETTKYSDRYFSDDGQTLSEVITSWYPSDTKIKFGERRKEKNHMGSYDQQRYTFEEVLECVAIEQYLGPVPIDPLSNRRAALGTIMIRGYYCLGASGLSDDYAKSIFDAIDVPSRPKEEVRAY